MKTISILFAGDFAPCRRYEPVVLEKQEAVFGDALTHIRSADLAFVNLECPITSHGQAIEKSGPALKAAEGAVSALVRAGFSIAGLANNHILDYGPKGLKDTLDACDSHGLSVVGAGMDLAAAQRPFEIEIEAVKVAIIAVAEPEFSQADLDRAGAAPVDAIDNYQQIRAAQERADVVIVTLHGGNEYFPYPRPGLRKLCQFYIDLGVDAVICHHPHVPGAYELHRGKPIFYCLGNFIFDTDNPPKDWELGYMVDLTFDCDSKSLVSMELIPYEQSVSMGGIQLLGPPEKAKFLARIEEMRRNLERSISWEKEWQSLVRDRADRYLRSQYSPAHFKGLGFLWRHGFMQRLLFDRKNSLTKLNLIRCESHRELLQSSLELMIRNARD